VISLSKAHVGLDYLWLYHTEIIKHSFKNTTEITCGAGANDSLHLFSIIKAPAG
jgi:hypothetical protein